MKNLGGVVAVCVLAAALVACDSAPVAVPATSVTSATTATATTATTTASLSDRLPKLVERATFPRNAMADRGVAEPNEQRYAVSGMPQLCDFTADTGSGYRPGLYRKWGNESFTLRQYVIGFAESTGEEVLDQLATAARDCSTWTEKDLEIRVVQAVSVNRPDGVDAFLGRCLALMQNGRLHWICLGFMGYGNLVSCLTVSSTAGFDATLAELHALLPRAAERLLKA
ncbi:hypothetical protein [Actinosynnema sp. NPDC023587]|uniref:hypothetical protein n=1 Tax=Actinosynnema sp. NPDC023587 TaxID=3154695 RepID=UPI0033CE6038